MSFTPSLETVIQNAIDVNLAEVHTCMPARVISYDSSKQQASVQPVLKRRYNDGGLVLLPVISNVPVVHPRANNAILHVPVKADDIVTLVFAERSLDKWLSQGGVVDPDDARRHDLSDAIAIPGGYPFSSPASVGDATALTLGYGSTELRLKENAEATLAATMVRLGTHSAAHPAGKGDSIQTRLLAIESAISTLVTYLGLHVHTSAAPGSPTSPPTVPPTPYTPDTTVVTATKVSVE